MPKKNDIVYIDNKVNLKKIGDINLTINKKLNEQINNISPLKIKIKCFVYAHSKENIRIEYRDSLHSVKKLGIEVEQSKNSPITEERIKEVLSKLGNTPFILENIEIDMGENIFIPIKVLNEMRRTLINDLIKERTKVNRHKEISFALKDMKQVHNNELKISALARNEEQLKTLLEEKIDEVYVTDWRLYQKYKLKDNIYFRLNRVLNNHKKYIKEHLLIGETGSINYAKNNTIVSDYYLNVVNSAYLNYLKQKNIKRITLSPELSKERIKKLLNHDDRTSEIEIVIYGRIEYMIMKYNLKENMNLNGNNYFLQDKNKQKYPIISDQFTHLMSNKPIDLISDIKDYQLLGITHFRLELYDENREEIKILIKRIKK